jgi:hypothetical protein
VLSISLVFPWTTLRLCWSFYNQILAAVLKKKANGRQQREAERTQNFKKNGRWVVLYQRRARKLDTACAPFFLTGFELFYESGGCVYVTEACVRYYNIATIYMVA